MVAGDPCLSARRSWGCVPGTCQLSMNASSAVFQLAGRITRLYQAMRISSSLKPANRVGSGSRNSNNGSAFGSMLMNTPPPPGIHPAFGEAEFARRARVEVLLVSLVFERAVEVPTPGVKGATEFPDPPLVRSPIACPGAGTH